MFPNMYLDIKERCSICKKNKGRYIETTGERVCPECEKKQREERQRTRKNIMEKRAKMDVNKKGRRFPKF